MSIKFNIDEIFKIAIQIEKNGAVFYKKASEIASDKALKEKLISLADMELDHQRTFSALHKELSENKQIATTYDPYNEGILYLKAFASGYVFDLQAEPLKMLAGLGSIERILKAAIGLEKDSIVFYLGIKKVVPPDFGKDKIEKIIAQEMEHIRLLSTELDMIRGM